MSDDKADPSADPEAYIKVGKVGIGDIDLSDDGKFLYFINLFDRKIYSIFINDPAQTPTVANVISFSIPNPNCSNSEFVPFGLKYYKGKLYVGVTCTAQTSGNYADLNATVFELNLTSNAFTNILSFPLTYTKGQTDSGVTSFDNKWNPWEDIWHQDGGGEITYPQAILSDIEIDVDGSLILGFMDRTGHQGGFENVDLNGNGSFLTVSGGDILRASNTNGTFVIENNGSVGGLVGCGANNNEGPNGGEFYCGEKYTQWHNEIIVGGLAFLTGSNEVMATGFDTDDDFYAGGTIRLSNINGNKNASNQFYITTSQNRGTFAKANGLGDLELLCNPQPIEIGNRVFMDSNTDGIQDPNEMGLDGIKVELWKAGAKVTEVTTANGGQYIFTNVDANTAYEVKILSADIPSGKSVTTSNTASNANDLIDSDAVLVGSDAVIAYTTGSAGENNHSLDFGFKTSCTLPNTISYSQTAGTCSGATPKDDAKIDFTGITNADKAEKSEGATYTGAPYSAATATVTTGAVSFTGLKHSTQYTFRIFNGSNACYKDTMFTTPSVLCAPICAIDITSTTPGSCYDNGAGQLIYDLSVMVSWLNAPLGQTINLTSDAGGATNIDPSTQTSPVFVTLTGLPGNGATTIVSAVFSTTATCLDNFTFTAPTCTITPKGSISGKIWKDTNDDGIENNGEIPFANVKVELYNADAAGQPTGGLLQMITVSNTGIYTFANLLQGDYVVKIDQTTIMSGMYLSSKKDLGGNDLLDSDFDNVSGLSEKIIVIPSNPATKDFFNINAAIRNATVLCPVQTCGEGMSVRKL